MEAACGKPASLSPHVQIVSASLPLLNRHTLRAHPLRFNHKGEHLASLTTSLEWNREAKKRSDGGRMTPFLFFSSHIKTGVSAFVASIMAVVSKSVNSSASTACKASSARSHSNAKKSLVSHSNHSAGSPLPARSASVDNDPIEVDDKSSTVDDDSIHMYSEDANVVDPKERLGMFLSSCHSTPGS